MKRQNNMMSDSPSFLQLIVIHSEHKMDVIKVEPNSDDEDALLSSHHQGELVNMAILPIALPVFRAEDQVSILEQTLCFVSLCLNTEIVWFMRH
jgi:hypothetical protein